MQDEDGYIVTLSEQLMGLEGGWGQRLEGDVEPVWEGSEPQIPEKGQAQPLHTGCEETEKGTCPDQP